jgi:hypothetical protein
MGRHWFDPAVTVESAQPGVSYAVSSVEQAADQLLEWPEHHGPEWREAAAACADALAEVGSADEARAAFIAAAKAADRLIST